MTRTPHTTAWLATLALAAGAAATLAVAQQPTPAPAPAQTPPTSPPSTDPATEPGKPDVAEAKPPVVDDKAKTPEASASEKPRKPATATGSPQRFEPTEKVRPDFDVPFPIDI
jgi:hypothetical protein